MSAIFSLSFFGWRKLPRSRRRWRVTAERPVHFRRRRKNLTVQARADRRARLDAFMQELGL